MAAPCQLCCSLARGLLFRRFVSKGTLSRVVSRNLSETGTERTADDNQADTSSSRSFEDRDFDEDSDDTEYSTKQQILKAALPFVSQHGWSKRALAAGAEAEGLPSIAHGMFPGGGAELVFYFYGSCNERLVRHMEAELTVLQDQGQEKPPIRPFIRNAVETRLMMIAPYIGQWPQAMAIQVLPQNAPESWSLLSRLVDDIWYHAGDLSTDFNWYTKRAILAAAYKSTEIFMSQDRSENFDRTWNFLDNRLDNVASFGKAARNVRETSGVLTEGLWGLCIMARNVMGMNARYR